MTSDSKKFAWLCRQTQNRIGIVTEGDSWFSYPPNLLLKGPNSNVIDWVVSAVKDSGKANLLRLASNGDEAVHMISGKQKHDLAELLKKNGDAIHFLMFSGGGNDLVGKWDMERLLNTYEPGFTAAQCIQQERFKRKLQRITLAYQELLELQAEYAPNTIIISHTYDRVQPSPEKAKFLWGRVRLGPWIYPFLEQKGVPATLHLEITDLLLGALGELLLKLARQPRYRDRLVVVNTFGTLRPGHRQDWINEIHPTSQGFKRISKMIYGKMRELQPRLPAM